MLPYHIPVLLNKSVSALNIKVGGTYVDATFGGGGHSREILKRLGPDGRLIAFDKDSQAIANAPDDKRLTLIHNDFRFIRNFTRYLGYEYVDGIIADLGVSSHQFDCGERGFSFRFDAPLDMRMNTGSAENAADIVNGASEEELSSIFYKYGELDGSKKIASLLCRARNNGIIKTTEDLCSILSPLYNNFTERKFLAKVFQALRIKVNGEMKSLEDFLAGAIKVLCSGGRLSVITYHSLEDRMVKNFIRAGNADGKSTKDFYGNQSAPLEAVNRKPIVPSEEEISQNTRSRSAKLRIAQKK
ncbi:MAG: 16S rRNA (cytosine(1402)-N(4))-methyltransferase RsmH [Bacteroidales bacterium]|jgi:16S rRNA (cytosine1402-N4)-methyltransferase|nr:16S rRNA (cytosine(1402)-N(4))-methyltransferase RsmH [Bacteroidales bacterium]